MNTEFTFLGLKIEKIAIIYGLFLILWGVFVSIFSNSNSLTSFIPSIFGIIVISFTSLSKIFHGKRKLFIHLVVLTGVLILLGGLDFFRSLNHPFENYWADLSKLMLLLSGSFFTYINIKSFIFIRKNRTN
tara:strand:+ start:133 stop:525 length:393 start_codon:yes stop_codon:yes gene_type:complete